MPLIMNNFKKQDTKSSDFTIKLINGDSFNLHTKSKRLVIVFWATWCGPCEVELNRINKLVKDGKIKASDILAISSNEEESIVKEKAKRENYLFNVGLDSDGIIANQYQVSATPTIIFIDENKVINWVTAGISPTLEYRVSSFLN